MKSLVVYYSRSGNARFVAQTIAAELGSDVEEVVDLKNRGGVLGFLSGGFDAMRGKETKIGETKKSPADYDLVVVGTPVWGSRPTPAIRTYLRRNDFSGVKVALFFAQGGKKPKAVDRTKKLIPNGNFAGELSLTNALDNKAESEKKIIEWCLTLKSP
jgi:flavodoxin